VSLPMEYEISPEPTEEERTAILAALQELDQPASDPGAWQEDEA